MKAKMILMLILILGFSCSTEPIQTETAQTQARGNGKGKGKPQKAVYFKPSIAQTSQRASLVPNTLGRIMATPVDYLGDISDLEATIDWNNDGALDNMETIQRCYFPITFMSINVNGELVNDFTPFGAKVVGFKDVDGDGFKDVIFLNAISEPYQDPATSYKPWDANQSYNVGDRAQVILGDNWYYTTFVCMQENIGEEPSPTSTFWRLPYSVGYNVAGNSTPTLAEVIGSLVIDSSDPNPEFIKWDLSEYGIENFTFHVFLYNKRIGAYEQTTTYGEFGFHSLNKITTGDVYVLRFTNLGEDCTNIEVEFIL